VLYKSDMHLHTSEDPMHKYLDYDAKKLIDIASSKDYKILSITLHDKVLESKELKKYAETKGILLITGVELTIENKDVLIHGVNQKDIENIKTFKDLKKLKKEKKNKILIVAPHPFYPKLLGKSLQNKFYEHQELFDALEIQQLRFGFINPNNKAYKAAKKLNKALIANSDTHVLYSFGKHYSLIELPANFNQQDVFDAIRNKKIQIVNNDINIIKVIKIMAKYLKRRYFSKHNNRD